MADVTPDPPRSPIRRQEVIVGGGAVVVAGAAVIASIAIPGLSTETAADILRLIAAVVLILAAVWVATQRVATRLRRIEERLADEVDAEHELYIRAYMDGLMGRGQ